MQSRRHAAKRTLFDEDDPQEFDLASSPSPKPNRSDKEGFGRISNLYTAFSKDFARHALEQCLLEGHRRIADPFAGMGTVAEAGRGTPLTFRLNDLNPYAVLANCVRSSDAQSILDACDILERIARVHRDDTDRKFFARNLTRLAGAQDVDLASAVMHAGLDEFRLTAIALFGLTTARVGLHKKLKGSNPTWTKRAEDTKFSPARIEAALKDALTSLRIYASKLEPLHPKYSAETTCSDIGQLKARRNGLDAIVTSPPYPNRTDYIRHYLPASELLISAIGEDERDLRQRQIGTPLIRETLPTVALPKSVKAMLEQIRSHGSYASERYYHKGFLYYFADMRSTLDRFSRWLVPGGGLLLVLQDTYYKDIHIPVADLFIDMASDSGFKLKSRADWRVRHALSRLSPHSRRSTRNSDLKETAIYFSK